MKYEKVKKLIEEFSFNSENKYFAEALHVAKYELQEQEGMPANKQLKEVGNPNRVLALIGDRVLKLVLSQEKRNRSTDIDEINDFINNNESNEHLHSLNIITPSHGY